MKIQPDSWIPSGVNDLESNAWEVVKSRGHRSVIAGPGAGKTELLAQRACFLLQTGQCIEPKRILAISFKRDAAINLGERVAKRCKQEDARRFDSFTFDAFSKGLLERFFRVLPTWCRPTENYELFFPSFNTFRDFLQRPQSPPPAHLGNTNDLQTIPPNSFYKNYVLAPLPLEGYQINNLETWAAAEWWKSSIHRKQDSSLTFPMIGRLVELLLRHNILIARALQSTYSHVFLDEFQDTTHVQYDLLKTAFYGSSSIVTAVGDNKQQIMRWAMALEDPFGIFEHDFKARRVPLLFNYRSSAELVEVQHRIAVNIDPHVQRVTSQSESKIGSEFCEILDFSNPDEEAAFIADLVHNDCEAENLYPNDFAVLVKQKASGYHAGMDGTFADKGLKIRNEAELQDLLSERLASLIIAFLRMGVDRRAGPYWAVCREYGASFLGIDANDIEGNYRLDQEMEQAQRSIYSEIQNKKLEDIQVDDLIQTVIELFGEDLISATYPEYRQKSNYERVLNELSNQIKARLSTSNSWKDLLDDLEGNNSVPLMTIHKSKGLEYHTIIFVGLDDQAWWSFKNDPEESRSAFFVAFSRAKQRVLFTFCEERGGRHVSRERVASLYDILRESGIRTRRIST